MSYDAHTRHNQPRTVAVVFDPDGGENPCHDVTNERYDAAPRYWCAGMTGRSVEELADRLWPAWNEPCEPVREWDELRAREGDGSMSNPRPDSPVALADIAADKLDQLAADLDAAKVTADKYPRCSLTEPLFVSHEKTVAASRVDAGNALSQLSLAIGSGQDSVSAYNEARAVSDTASSRLCTWARTWAREWRAFARASSNIRALDTAKAAMSVLTAEQRLEVMSAFCRGCGREQPAEGPRCQCWNDE